MLDLYSEDLIHFQLHQAKRVKCHTSPSYKTQCLSILGVSKKRLWLCATLLNISLLKSCESHKTGLICSPWQPPARIPSQLVPANLKRAQTEHHHCHNQSLVYYHNALGNPNTLQIHRSMSALKMLFSVGKSIHWK